LFPSHGIKQPTFNPKWNYRIQGLSWNIKFSYESLDFPTPTRITERKCCIFSNLPRPCMSCSYQFSCAESPYNQLVSPFSLFCSKQENVVTRHSEPYTSSPRNRRSGLLSRRTSPRHRQNIPKCGDFGSDMGSRCTFPPRHFHHQICNFSHLTLDQILNLFEIEKRFDFA